MGSNPTPSARSEPRKRAKMVFPVTIDVPTFSGSAAIEARAAASVVFIGANGAGKTRLGVFLDKLRAAHPQVEVIAIDALDLNLPNLSK